MSAQPEQFADRGVSMVAAPFAETVSATVAAVVVTYERRDRLRRWLECMSHQTIPLSEIIVVDNGSQDGSPEMVRDEFPEVTLIALHENLGPSAAAAEGMQAAYEHGHQWIWAFDDDAFPQPTALEQALRTADEIDDPDLGMVWLPFDDFGGWKWRGRKVPVSVKSMIGEHKQPFQIDQVDLNMTLISRSVIEKVGVPRKDFFIMLWSCEYCLRLADAGFSIWVAPEVLVRHEHAGSTGVGMWRSYYQTRNQLVMALGRKSPVEMWWWTLRQIRFVAGTLLRHDRKWERIKLRMRGVFDGLRGRMGKQVDPARYK